MKAISLFTLLALVAPLSAQETPAKSESAETKRELLPNQQKFLNLPEESRKNFVKHVGDASRLFQEKRIFECLDKLAEANKIFDESPEVYNLRGSCYVEMRAFDKALVDFSKARELTRGEPSVEFNVGEVYFVTQEWQKALDVFVEVMKKLPPENIALGRLIEFKIMLCKKKLGQENEAAILAEKYTFEDDSPYYYYAQAALAYDKEEMVEAEEWLARAGRVFRNPAVLAPWQDTLVEYGYVKSFYGNDQSPTEE